MKILKMLFGLVVLPWCLVVRILGRAMFRKNDRVRLIRTCHTWQNFALPGDIGTVIGIKTGDPSGHCGHLRQDWVIVQFVRHPHAYCPPEWLELSTRPKLVGFEA